MPPLDSSVGLAARIHAALPQTQCTRCGFPDCAAYAKAVAEGDAGINQCPPGGAQGIARLAALTGQAFLPLHPDYGVEQPRSVAFIDESWCIGCTLCIKACPTDAIVGANKLMHTVIEPYCTGCELCIPVCPVDCIQLENASGTATGWNAWSPPLAQRALQRYTARAVRAGQLHQPTYDNPTDSPNPLGLVRNTAPASMGPAAGPVVPSSSTPPSSAAPGMLAVVSQEVRTRHSIIEAALQRARSRSNQKRG